MKHLPHSPEELRALVAGGNLEPDVRASLDPAKPYGVDYYDRTRSRRLSRDTKKRAVEPAPRSEWVAIPVCLEGALIDRAAVDAARRHVEANRASSKAGKREWELSRGFLFCGDCGRSMSAVVTRDRKFGTDYHYYACPEPRAARPAAPSRCRNRCSHPAAALEHGASELFEATAHPRMLAELYEQAIEEERKRLGLDEPVVARETHERLSAELETLREERRGYLKQNARGVISDGELHDLLAETDREKDRVTCELRATEEAINAADRGPFYSPRAHAEWYEDPDAVHPEEWLTYAADVEQTRAAYRRYGARFMVGAEGDLTLRMELPLDDPSDGPVGILRYFLRDLTTTPRRSTTDRPRRRRRLFSSALLSLGLT